MAASKAPPPVNAEPPADELYDVNGRIAWLLRSWRNTGRFSQRSLSVKMSAAGHSVSSPTLSRAEARGVRNDILFSAYEDALDLTPGALRAPISVVCRTFPHAAGDSRYAFKPEGSYEAFTAACADVEQSQTVSGPQWLRLVEHHVHSGFGLPAYALRPLVNRLVDEMRRGFSTAYAYRYEALAMLRCSDDYEGVVLEAIQEAVMEPGAQLLGDLMSAVSERPSHALLTWCTTLLTHESWPLMSSATLAIQNMQTVNPGKFDEIAFDLVEPLISACNDPGAGSAHLRTLATSLETLPAPVRDLIAQHVTRQLPPVRRPSGWSEDRRNRHFSYAETMAAALVTNPTDEPMLARLLFDLLFDFRAAHSTSAAFLLRASPYADQVQQRLIHDAFNSPDRTTRHGATLALSQVMTTPLPEPQQWLASPDPIHQGLGLEICGWASVQVAEQTLFAALTMDDQLARHGLFSAGMSRHPALEKIAADVTLPVRTRLAAEWWLRHDDGPIIE